MKIIAVSQRVDHFPERGETRDALDRRLVQFCFKSGFLAVPVPNFGDLGEDQLGSGLQRWLETVPFSGIILSGGNDIGSSSERDVVEEALMQKARDEFLPVLGICRGMQMMLKQYGSTLKKVEGHVGTRHTLDGLGNGEVNSYHNYSVVGCPDAFEVTARSEDGEIEAVKHRYLRWEGWMWHPEREIEFSPQDIERFRLLFG